ncbi:MAG: hypothetical protein KY475_26100, partial [Planctomycetes bacterium]|nr:hypothetical protein [Planctomycetota bacterium]
AAAAPGAARRTHHETRRRILASLFPADAWELTDPRVKVLETDYGMLLLADYHTREDVQLGIRPCTMVLEIPREDAARPPRYVAMQAPDGAVLQFEESIDLRRAEFSKPIGGRLLGEVRIFSPPTQADGGDALDVATQNVQMNARRVWTPHEVKFRFGRSYGAGRGLTIDLLPIRSPAARSTATFAVAGLRSLELSHLEEAHLEAPPEGLFAAAAESTSQPQAGGDLGREALERPLEITCEGPFRFDFEEFAASFADDVDVRRLHPNGPSDHLSCRLLEIFFTPPDAGGAEQDDVVRRVIAWGRPVIVRAPSLGAFVEGDRLEYDVVQRRLRLENRRALSPGDAAESGNAVMEHQGRYFAAPRLQYDLGPPGRLGTLWATGPGVLRGVVPKTSKHLPELPQGAAFEVAWQGDIHLRPHEGMHVASVTGGASATAGEVGGFSAGELHVWLREVPEVAVDPQQREPKYRVIPDRLLAQRGVELKSPRFSGGVGKLEVWFEDAPPLPPESPNSPFGPQQDDRSQPRRQAFDLRSDLVQVRLLRRGDETTLEDATLRGNVVLRETQTEKPDETPLVVTGDLVELRGFGGAQTRLVVLGDPQRGIRAEAGARGMVFSGWQLHVDQSIGRVWSDGPGRLTLPLEPRSLAQVASVPQRPRGGPSTISVYWRKGLNFDGHRLLIEENVETRGETQVIRSDSLQAFLGRPLDFADPEQFRNAEVARLVFGGRPEDVHGVSLENQSIEGGELTSLDRGETRDLEIDLIAGRMHAAGPGWIESVRRGGFDMVGPSTLQPAPAGAPGKGRGLTFVRIDFQRAITGQAFTRDLSQWKMTFHDSVETIVGPVERWEQRLSADSPSSLGPRGMLLTSQELSVTQMGVTPQGDRQMELAAIGRPHIESMSFTADGDRLSYDGAKGLLVLEGGREDARFWHRTNTGFETDGTAQSIKYWPHENRLDADLRYIDLTTGFRSAAHKMGRAVGWDKR